MKEQNAKKIFQEVLNVQDRIRIIGRVASAKINIKARVKPGVEFITQPIAWFPPTRLEVNQPKGVKLGLQKLIVQFDADDERYFSKVDLAFDDWKLFFVFSHSLFRLHRRQYQRIKMPAKYKNHVLLMKVNQEVWNEECEILDVSLGGCSLKLSYRSIDVPIGSALLMDMKIGEGPMFTVIGTVCYKRLQKFNGKSSVRVGVKFRPHPQSSQHLERAVQDLAVNIFSNWSQRTF